MLSKKMTSNPGSTPMNGLCFIIATSTIESQIKLPITLSTPWARVRPPKQQEAFFIAFLNLDAAFSFKLPFVYWQQIASK